MNGMKTDDNYDNPLYDVALDDRVSRKKEKNKWKNLLEVIHLPH